jgi:hypothetical protein
MTAPAAAAPEWCESPDGPHPLDWLTPDFAYCHGCQALYCRQPGTLVWVFDPWAVRLAEALAAARGRLAEYAAGLTPTGRADPDDPTAPIGVTAP